METARCDMATTLRGTNGKLEVEDKINELKTETIQNQTPRKMV